MDPCLPRLDSEGLDLLSKLLLVSTTHVSWSSLPDPDFPDLVPLTLIPLTLSPLTLIPLTLSPYPLDPFSLIKQQENKNKTQIHEIYNHTGGIISVNNWVLHIH